jgi:hypothetical protein
MHLCIRPFLYPLNLGSLGIILARMSNSSATNTDQFAKLNDDIAKLNAQLKTYNDECEKIKFARVAYTSGRHLSIKDGLGFQKEAKHKKKTMRPPSSLRNRERRMWIVVFIHAKIMLIFMLILRMFTMLIIIFMMLVLIMMFLLCLILLLIHLMP